LTTDNPDEIIFEGIQIDVTEASLAEGDRFNIVMHHGAAGAMGVSLSNLDQIAAAESLEALPGGNGNAIALAQLQENQIASLKMTFQGFFAGFKGEVGARAQLAKTNFLVEESVSKKLDTMREEVRGVSLDEEMTNLISFQRAYQASARLITMADELLETVIGMKR
jgi:flagellar hook-associated protein 1 FlgK